MPFLPKTRKEKLRLFYIVLFLCYIGIEIKFGADYSAERDSDFRAFRWDTTTLWRLKSSYSGTAFGQKIHTNSEGFRWNPDIERHEKQKKHALRIITFGDSRTYGYGVKDDETYSYIMQRELQKKGIDAEVINTGTHGFSSIQCRSRLEQMIAYNPDVVVFAPGYNDRRYIVTRAEDSEESNRNIGRLRKVVDVFQLSNVFFGLMHEIGMKKLAEIKDNPPGLDVIPLRVSETRFEDELNNVVTICQENSIKLIFLKIYQNPSTFGFVEEAVRYHESGETTEAIEMIEEAFNTIPNRAYPMSRYYLGVFYEAIGDESNARKAYDTHRPTGSIFGEAILRSEKTYFDIFHNVAEANKILLVDGRTAIISGVELESRKEETFRKEFIDECHYSAIGHQRMGLHLSNQLEEYINQHE